MIVDAVDASGRRYMHAMCLHWSEPCVECGTVIAAGDSYYMRNDHADGTQDDPLEAALTAITYDAVCVPCGEKQLLKDAG